MSKVFGVVLTHNAVRFNRIPLLERTIETLISGVDQLLLFDNGSDDGTTGLLWAIICSYENVGLNIYLAPDSIHTCGRGMNASIALAAIGAKPDDIIVFSNDDVAWDTGVDGKENFAAVLRRYYAAKPQDIKISSGILQPEYPWNTPREAGVAGDVPYVVRDSCQGAAWTMLAADVGMVLPVIEEVGVDDVPKCEELRRHGYRVCDLDVAVHIGDAFSTWGNKAYGTGRPIDRALWGFPDR